MKRAILSKTGPSRNHLDSLSEAAKLLSDVAKASSIDEVNDALASGAPLYKKVKSQKAAIKSLLHTISFLGSEYLLEANAEENLPQVRDEIVSFLKESGYPVKKLDNISPRFEVYVVLPANKATHDDLIKVASALSKEFGIKPDTGIIGGSWTAYNFSYDGVKFKIQYTNDVNGGRGDSAVVLSF